MSPERAHRKLYAKAVTFVAARAKTLDIETHKVSIYVVAREVCAKLGIVPLKDKRAMIMQIFDNQFPPGHGQRWIDKWVLGTPRRPAHSRQVKATQSQTIIPFDDDRVRDFYKSAEWVRLSYDVKKERGRRCECCGATPAHGVRIITDHVKPIRKYWHLRLERSNLQVLCDDCNLGKGSRDETDFRSRGEEIPDGVSGLILAQLTPPDGVFN